MSKFAMGVVASFGLAFAVSASAQTSAPAAPVHADSGLPFCSAKVKDRCVQRVDLKREGKSAATKAAN
ncbi:hypothetical protein L6Q21_01390 [Sandaracinobacter sp. RS1-74]|uniref:hypothetical protein n=1 Tax=Sandaracinobacteroides sayramensis TaxID=2913411 RepID=UPI001EDACAD1|nr:hypothetical protein [Sandaracinobacteroides sayramensis]MCG2839632.1 hypothetical protein [Sandaracinobacteroides sayramensis]